MSSVPTQQAASPFAEAYRESFEELERKFAIITGFVLLPVEVPSVDVGIALCEFFETRGTHVDRVPTDPRAWDTVVGDLLSLPIPAAEKAIVVALGPREPSSTLILGVERVNRKRDSVANHLGRPLLWCGVASFMATTWEHARDLWSIRDMPHVIRRIELGDSAHVPGGGPWIEPTDEPAHYEALVEAATTAMDEPNLARHSLLLARSLLARGKLEDAERAFEQARSRMERIPLFRRSIEAGLCMETRGDLDWARENARRAQPAYEQALEAYRDIHDKHGMARMMGKLGRVAHRLSDWPRAAQLYDEALSTSESLGDLALRAHLLQARGRFRQLQSDFAGATRDVEESAALFRRIKDRRGEADSLKTRADIFLRMGDIDAALPVYEEALALFRAVGSQLGQANVLLATSLLRFQKGNKDRAIEDIERSLSLFASVGDRLGQAHALRRRGDLRKEFGQTTDALADYDAALERFRAVEDTRGEAQTFVAKADFAISNEDLEGAMSCATEALRLFERTGSAYDLSSALLRIARIHQLFGHIEPARMFAERARDAGEKGGHSNVFREANEILDACARADANALQLE